MQCKGIVSSSVVVTNTGGIVETSNKMGKGKNKWWVKGGKMKKRKKEKKICLKE